MALTITDIANYLFKKAQGKGSTNNSRQFFEEPRNGLPSIFTSQIWSQSADIPSTAPVLSDQQVSGVVKYWDKLSLTAVPGVSNSFYSDDLRDAIPFNHGDGSYNYALFNSSDASIPFGLGDWIVDREAGLVTYYGSVPPSQPPKISFYQYVGEKADVGGLGGGGGSGNISGYYDDGQLSPEELTVNGIRFLRFDEIDLKYRYYEMPIPLGYKEGSRIAIEGNLFRALSSDDTKDVLFRAQAYLKKPGDSLATLGTPYTSNNSTVNIDPSSGVATSTGPIFLNNEDGEIDSRFPAYGDKIIFRIYRDLSNESDGYPGDVDLVKDSFNVNFNYKAP